MNEYHIRSPNGKMCLSIIAADSMVAILLGEDNGIAIHVSYDQAEKDSGNMTVRFRDSSGCNACILWLDASAAYAGLEAVEFSPKIEMLAKFETGEIKTRRLVRPG
jgi:hypothetical protein